MTTPPNGKETEPIALSQAVGMALERRSQKLNSGKPTNSALSTNGSKSAVSDKDFAISIAHLCALKRTTHLTKTELNAWHAVLGIFSREILNYAVLEMVLTEVRFPEVGDLYQICRREAIRRGHLERSYSPQGADTDSKKPERAEIAAVAQRLGMDV